MASGPFIQQVIKYHPCPQVVPSLQASVLRTNNYTINDITSLWGYEGGPSGFAINAPMQAALYEGVYDSFSGITPTCPTGNCTFPLYRTVGMCSGCSDISDTIIMSYETDIKNCAWQLPSGITINFGGADIGTQMAPADNTTTFSVSEILSFTDLFINEVLDVENVTDCLLYGPSHVVAVQCSLFPCVRTYSMEVLQNQNTEVLLDTSEMVQQQTNSSEMVQQLMYGEVPLMIGNQSQVDDTDAMGPYIGAPMPCLIDNIYYEATSFTEPNTTNIWPVRGLLPNNAIAYLPSSCVFMWEYPQGLQQFLQRFLEGNITVVPPDGPYFGDPDWMVQLNNGGNVTFQSINAFWAAIADSITMLVRTSGDPSNSAPAMGSAYQTDTCVSVQWSWLSFPAALLILTLVFLIATIVQSRKHNNLHIWKGSPLALLYHGMDQNLSDRYRLVDGLDEMEEKASQTVVQIKDVEGELRFVDAAQK
jgi:hypothetical protein